MDADLDLLLISVYCTADDLLPERPANARRKLSDAEIVTLCVAQVLMGIPSDRRFCEQRSVSSGTSSPSCLPRTLCTSAARAWPRRSSGWWACSPSARPDRETTSSCSTRRRWSVAARSRRRVALRSPRSAATATRAATRATSGGCACTSRVRLTGRRGRPRSWVPTVPSARWRSGSCRRRSEAARRSSATRATPGASSPPRSPLWAPRSCDLLGVRSQTTASISRPSASASNRSSARAKTCSRSNATVRATPRNLFARIATRLLALAACICLNHELGRPSRAIADYTA